MNAIAKWAKRLEKVLIEAPDGIVLVATGDKAMSIHDSTAWDSYSDDESKDDGLIDHVRSSINIVASSP